MHLPTLISGLSTLSFAFAIPVTTVTLRRRDCPAEVESPEIAGPSDMKGAWYEGPPVGSGRGPPNGGPPGGWHGDGGGSNSGPAPSTQAPVVSNSVANPPPVTSSNTPVSSSYTSPPVVSSQSPSASPSPVQSGGSGSSGGSSGSGGAVGVGINPSSGTNLASFGGKLSWYYNWDTTPANIQGFEYVPQIWGSGSVSSFTGDVSGSKYIMGFNEPDQPTANGGSSIDASTAATLHQQWTAKVPSGVSIGAPAIAGSFSWMDSFVSACAGKCTYDFIPIHYYGTDANALISYAQSFHSRYGNKPLWLTEWACHDFSSGQTCTNDQIETFMKTAIDWFEGEGSSIVVRWAYFGAFETMAADLSTNGMMDSDGSANALGKYYASL